ncbi:disulfide bond formation protein B [Candidatus Woesearchaeota archaeon]|nr:disulfide bond formation protein B [Candidatus Woesearchaeota archaeon]
MELLLAWGTLFAHVVLALFLIVWFIAPKKFSGSILARSFKENALNLAFFIALGGTLGSLFFSTILHYEPCWLCWWQRIFLFPLVFVLGIGMLKEIKSTSLFGLPLAIVGAIIAAYHTVLQNLPAAEIVPCTLGAVDCATPYATHFGYISIPVMSLTAFVLILFFLVVEYRRNTGSR